MEANCVDDGTEKSDCNSHSHFEINLSPENNNSKAGLKAPSAKFKKLSHPTERSILCICISGIMGIFAALTIGFPLTLFFTAFLPFAMLLQKWLISCSPVDQLLTPTEMMLLPCLPAHCVLELEGHVRLNILQEIVLSRVVCTASSDGLLAYPRLCQKVVHVIAGPCWAMDSEFDICSHLTAAEVDVSARKDLEGYLTKLTNLPLRGDKPLWEILVIWNYGERRANTLLIFRLHPCLADGISLLKVLCQSLADGSVESLCASRPRFGGATYPLNVLRAVIGGPWTFLCWLFHSSAIGVKKYYPLEKNNRKLGSRFGVSKEQGKQMVLVAKEINLALVQRVKQVTRSTYNDVIIAALAGSLRRQIMCSGVANPYDVIVNIAIDLRYDGDGSKLKIPQLGCKYSVVSMRLPTNTEGAIPRLWQVRSQMEDLKSSSDSAVMHGAVFYLKTLLPECLSNLLLTRVMGRATAFFSSLPGPEVQLTIGSYKLKSILFCSPSLDHNVPISFNVITYGQSLQVILQINNPTVIPNPKLILKEFKKQLLIMSDLLAHRRAPGEHRPHTYIVVARDTATPSENIQDRLTDVQDELQRLSDLKDESEYEDESIQMRIDELREEFSELLGELRRRKSVVERGGLGLTLPEFEDEDEDGEIRRPRKNRALSIISMRRSSLVSSTSMIRPLATASHSTGHVSLPGSSTGRLSPSFMNSARESENLDGDVQDSSRGSASSVSIPMQHSNNYYPV